MSRCNNKSRGNYKTVWFVACICTHSLHTCWPHTSSLIPPVATERGGWRGQLQQYISAPETAYFLSSHISALRDTGISAVTAWQFSAAHSDSDLSALNTVTFSNGTWGEWTGSSRANVAMNQCPPLGLAFTLAVSLPRINQLLVCQREVVAQWQLD